MIEYAILIVMVISTIGFVWLWLIEQKKIGGLQHQLGDARIGR